MIAVEYKVEFVRCIDEAINGENTAIKLSEAGRECSY